MPMKSFQSQCCSKKRSAIEDAKKVHFHRIRTSGLYYHWVIVNVSVLFRLIFSKSQIFHLKQKPER